MTKISSFFLLMCIKTVLVSTFDPWLNTYGYLEVSKDWKNNYMKNIQCESKNFENTATVDYVVSCAGLKRGIILPTKCASPQCTMNSRSSVGRASVMDVKVRI